MPTTPALPDIRWDIRPEGRRLTGDEFHERCQRFPEKTEMIDGEVLCTDEERTAVLGTVLELLGTRAAVQLGDPGFWREAIRDLP